MKKYIADLVLPNCHCLKEGVHNPVGGQVNQSLENTVATIAGRPVIYSRVQTRTTGEELYIFFKQILLSASLKPDDTKGDYPVKLIVCLNYPQPLSICPFIRIWPLKC